MSNEKSSLSDQLVALSSQEIQSIIEKTYDRFFSPHSLRSASLEKSPKLSNLLLRLADFATIVEGNAAMKNGDIGQVMNVWKQWAIIAQGVKKLTQYSIQLPWMIILLNEILPKGLGQVIRHSLFIAPSGRPKHFVAKDQYLETQNYWLKYFFNHSGSGTNIDCLKDVYSLNVPLVCKSSLSFFKWKLSVS